MLTVDGDEEYSIAWHYIVPDALLGSGARFPLHVGHLFRFKPATYSG